MRKIAASLLAAVALLLGAAPAAAQGPVFPQTLPDHTVVGRIGSGTGSGPAQAIPFANLAGTLGAQAPGVVTVVRPPGTYTGENAVWVAKGPDGVALCTPAVDATACLHAAIAAAHPYAIGTPLLGYSLNVIGGLDPALSSNNHAGASALLSFSGPLVFPPVNTGSIISRDVSWNGTLQFDSFGTGSLLFEGGQILPSVCSSCVSVDFKPTNTPAANGGFIGMGPLYAHFSAVNGQFHFADWSGAPAAANAINSVEVKIDELEFAGATSGCAVLIDSPLIGSQNFTENRLQVMALNNLGSGSTGLCIGTQAPAGGAAFGRNYYDVTIEPDNGGTAKGVDTWASGDELHIKTWQFGTGAVLTFESGACKNVAYIFSDLASPTITDNGGCLAASNNCNVWVVNGQVFECGSPVATLGGTNTWTGSNTWNGAATFNSASLVTFSGSGGVLFTGTPPTLTANGQGGIGHQTTITGLLLEGQGSTSDILVANKNFAQVCAVATGTTTWACNALALTTPLPSTSGGTGVNNSSTITLGGAVLTAGTFTTSGAFGLTLTASATTNSTLPAGTHSLAQLDSPTFTGTVTAPIYNATTQYNINGGIAIDTTATYTRIWDPSGVKKLFFGNTFDQTTYLLNNNFIIGDPTNSKVFFAVDSKGHIGQTASGYTPPTAPAISACGTSPSVARGTDTAGEVTTGTGGTVTCTITFANSGYTAAPTCTITDQNGAALTYNVSTAALTVTAGSGTSHKLDWNCLGL